jgi:hypothetical protein
LRIVRHLSSHVAAGLQSEEAGGGPALLVGGLRQGGPDELDAGQAQLAEQQVDAGGVDFVDRFHAASPIVAAISS